MVANVSENSEMLFLPQIALGLFQTSPEFSP